MPQAPVQTVQPEAAYGQSIVISGGGTASAQTNGQINGSGVRFRSGPSSSSAILGEFDQGKPVTILGTEGDWTLCCIDGEYGYIFSRYVSGSERRDLHYARPV